MDSTTRQAPASPLDPLDGPWSSGHDILADLRDFFASVESETFTVWSAQVYLTETTIAHATTPQAYRDIVHVMACHTPVDENRSAAKVIHNYLVASDAPTRALGGAIKLMNCVRRPDMATLPTSEIDAQVYLMATAETIAVRHHLPEHRYRELILPAVTAGMRIPRHPASQARLAAASALETTVSRILHSHAQEPPPAAAVVRDFHVVPAGGEDS